MCASCVAQGVTYVGGSVGILRVMAYRASRRRVEDAKRMADAEADRTKAPAT